MSVDPKKKGLDKTLGMNPEGVKTHLMQAMPAGDAEAIKKRLLALGLDPNAPAGDVPAPPQGAAGPARLQRAANGTVMANLPQNAARAPGSVPPPQMQAQLPPQQQQPPNVTKPINRGEVLAQLRQQQQGIQPGRPPSGGQQVAAPVQDHRVAQQQQGSMIPQGRMPQSVMPPAPPMKPCAPNKADPRLMILKDPNGPQAAGFRVLRDTLLAKKLPGILAVSSAEAGEGKTTCAINLALALAEGRNEKFLLVDGHFAAPALAEALGVDKNAPAQAGPFTLSVLTPNLHVASIKDTANYVDFSTLTGLFQSFHRAGYRHIIVDAPPIENSPEGNLLLQLAGGVLIVVRSGKTTNNKLRKAVDRIGADKAVGVTLMDAPGA
jgi:Mrp family chromosome partitioning ATPase